MPGPLPWLPSGGGGGVVDSFSPLQLVVDVAAGPLNLVHQGAALLELLAHELDGALEHEALGAALALEPRDDLGEAVEALAYGLAALLLCRQG